MFDSRGESLLLVGIILFVFLFPFAIFFPISNQTVDYQKKHDNANRHEDGLRNKDKSTDDYEENKELLPINIEFSFHVAKIHHFNHFPTLGKEFLAVRWKDFSSVSQPEISRNKPILGIAVPYKFFFVNIVPLTTHGLSLSPRTKK
jgi:hypothetical protein